MTGAYIAAAWLAGIVAAAALPSPTAMLIAGAAAVALAARMAGVRPSWRLLLAVPALALGAALRYEAGQPHPVESGLARLNGGAALSVQGIVVTPPEDRGRSTRLRVEARALVKADGKETPIEGRVLATVAPEPRFRYGDAVLLHGELETPPVLGDFDYRDYLARRGIGSLMRLARAERTGPNAGAAFYLRLFELRTYLAGMLVGELPEPEAGLAQGMLLGAGAIATDLADDLNATGTSHLVVISGQNVAIIAALVITALAWLIGRRQTAVVALGVIVLYTLLAGADPPVVRGAIMGGAWTLATLLGRRSSAPVSLLLAAALMTAYQPSIARDVSFQLSFAATAGIAFVADR